MKVIIASDHAGFAYKTIFVKELLEKGYEVIDLGTDSEKPTDYPDQAEDIADTIINKKGERGIIICGSGVGVSIAANKFKSIRAGVCHDTYSAHQCVEHDDVNILCLGQRVIGIELAREIIYTFLNARYTNAPRHARRVEKIVAIEDKNMK
jgi:ribose 5-phosphate isomerase B